MRYDLTIFREEIFESICIELQLDDKNKIVIYRSPNNNINDFTDLFENFLTKINNENKKRYLMEDFI